MSERERETSADEIAGENAELDRADAAAAEGASESLITVIVAIGANLAIAAAKLVAGLLSGSASMLSEAVHSLSDTVTEVFLLVAVRRGSRSADASHPFGYGKESYLWAFLGALATLIAGGGFAVVRGIEAITSGEAPGDYLVAYIVLGVAFVLESVSWVRAMQQVLGQASQWRLRVLRYLSITPDTPVKAVAFEDSAALIGILLAAGGLVLTELTGSAVWDGVASITIGGLLVVVAVILVRDNKSLLVGQAIHPRLRAGIRAELEDLDDVDSVITLLTMQLGPNEVLVAAKVDFSDSVPASRVEEISASADRRLRERYSFVRHVFLDPTSTAAEGTTGI